MPIISVIVPVYNVSQHIRTCLDSILFQTYSNFEVLLIDDGSKDDSGAICDEYAQSDSRVRVFHKVNGGVSSARNVGIDNARGEWLTFIDSDDYIEQDYFPEVWSQDIDMYVQNWRVFGGGNAPFEQINNQLVNNEALPLFMAQYGHMDLFRMVAAKFVKRDIIVREKIRFQSQFVLGEDTLFFLEYYKHCHCVCVLDTSHYMYYRPKGNWNGKYNVKLNEMFSYEKEFWKRYKQTPYKCEKLLEFAITWFFSAVKGNEKAIKKICWIYNPTIMVMRKVLLNDSLFLLMKYQLKKTIAICRNQ